MNLWNNSIWFLFHILSVFAHQENIDDSAISLSDAQLEDFKQSIPTTDWIILFYADWCGACKQFKPAFHEFASWSKTNMPDLKVAAVNYSDSPSFMSRFRITQIPTVFLYNRPNRFIPFTFFRVKNGEYRDVSLYRDDLRSLLSNTAYLSIQPINPVMTPFSAGGNTIGILSYLGFKAMKFLDWLQSLSKVQLLLSFLIGVGAILLLFMILSIIENMVVHFINKRALSKSNSHEKSN